jgi:hypothetical protein
MSEFLRIKKGCDKIAKKQNGQYQRHRGDEIHGRLPQLLAGPDVKKRQAEEDCRKQEHCNVLHKETCTGEALVLNLANNQYPKDFLNKP